MRLPFSHPVPARFAALPLAILALSAARGEVVRVDISERGDIAGTGYEEIAGRLHFAVDPADPGNAIIADIALAPRDGAGRVRFSSDFRLLRPREGKAEAAWVEVPNRGSRSGLRDFMMRHGFVMLEAGWEFDVPAQPGRLRLEAPVAAEADGSPIRGRVEAVFVVNAGTGLRRKRGRGTSVVIANYLDRNGILKF